MILLFYYIIITILLKEIQFYLFINNLLSFTFKI